MAFPATECRCEIARLQLLFTSHVHVAHPPSVAGRAWTADCCDISERSFWLYSCVYSKASKHAESNSSEPLNDERTQKVTIYM